MTPPAIISSNGNAEAKKLRKFHPSERWRIVRNILVISVAFMLHFTAFHGTANLQSSVNAEEGVGTFTLAAIYGSLLLSNIILPTAVINWFGCKWTMAVSFISYMPFIAAQFYPKIYTLIPAGLMVGFGGGPLWCAKCTYLTVVSETYADVTAQPADMMITRYFGVFFMFYMMAQVWGNLITSSVLSMENAAGSNATLRSWDLGLPYEQYDNVSLSRLTKIQNCCGSMSCEEILDADDIPIMEQPDSSKIRLIAGIFLFLMLMSSVLIAFGVDTLKRYSGKRMVPKGTAVSKLLATLKHTREPYQMLLLPATSFIGAEQAFMAANYNSDYVGCAYGIKNIGFVMICFGISNALASAAAGAIVKITGRLPVMIFSIMTFTCIFTALLTWQPRPDVPIMFYVMAALWGIADAIWLVQVNALSGILFPGKEEASYSSFRLWEATGSVIMYVVSPFLHNKLKIGFLFVLMVIGLLGYLTIEILERKSKKGLPQKLDFELVDDKSKNTKEDK